MLLIFHFRAYLDIPGSFFVFVWFLYYLFLKISHLKFILRNTYFWNVKIKIQFSDFDFLINCLHYLSDLILTICVRKISWIVKDILADKVSALTKLHSTFEGPVSPYSLLEGKSRLSPSRWTNHQYMHNPTPVFGIFGLGITIYIFKNNTYRMNLIKAFDWCRNCHT